MQGGLLHNDKIDDNEAGDEVNDWSERIQADNHLRSTI